MRKTPPNVCAASAFGLLAILFMAPFAVHAAEVYQGDAQPLIAHIESPPEPAIHGPRVTGTTPGRPFLFLVPATGQAPLTYGAEALPAGLALDATSGIISGAVHAAGKYVVHLKVRNAKGAATRDLEIVAGKHVLALTPPMGWNPWHIWQRETTDAKMREAADWMIKSGLAAHGYQYINVDDAWAGPGPGANVDEYRDANGEMRLNKKFVDMKALADYVHAKGLRFGIYSSPGTSTWAGYGGSFGHEEQDARTFARWGADFLKYDWCSYTYAPSEKMTHPFEVMRAALDKCDRDIVYLASPMPNIWAWGEKTGLNLWRVYADINDTWERVSDIGFSQNSHVKYAGPGHWNDSDMLVVGVMKWGGPGPSRLTKDEQITHMTLWSLLASPLLIGCDLSKLDSFTLDLLTNDEVIDIDQDPLGKAASCRAQSGTFIPTAIAIAKRLNGTFAEGLLSEEPRAWGDVWARPLFDGTVAVGLFNRGEVPGVISAKWSDLGVTGPQPVRDLWRRKNLGEYDDSFSAQIPPHGAVLLKVGGPHL